jgi:hypothetical protein
MSTLLKLTLIFIAFLCSGWGFWAHKHVNEYAIYALPHEMAKFYMTHRAQLIDKSTAPDKRRYAVKEEACRHYLDIDAYGEDPFSIFPLRWDSAVARFTEDTLKAYGIVPWQIQWVQYRLQKAFEANDTSKILHNSAELGHYMSDACVPLHSTLNYNGQMTGQKGIHALWESNVPERYGKDWDYIVGRATYVDRVSDYVWKAFSESFAAKDSVLDIEMELREAFGEEKMYSFNAKKQQLTKNYSKEFIAEYHRRMEGMVERRMRRSIKAVADLWYTAWVDAGQPVL